ncbi:flagellin [Achromobacter sp.]|uniref:flagellin N-terminal helical domain-containing protein n=1 Tax=Achromobacter sp. TaxID=134375 RepID=UPI0031DA2002
MAAVINTNYLSLVAQNNLNKSQSSLGTAIERLSSGLRINSAKDDAAGMAIANRFTANVKGLTQAARNANDGISLAQTTEGAASEVNTHLQRIRELTVQASNGSYSQEQLDSVQGEINQRLADINRISEQTDFNGVKVLSNSAKPLTLQVGANDGETITLNLTEISAKTLGLDGFNVNGTGVVQNRTANINDISNPGNSTNVTVSGGYSSPTYDVETKNTAAKASDLLGKLSDGNTVTVTDGKGSAAAGDDVSVVYTYNAADDNFTFTNSSSKFTVAADAKTFVTDQKLIPANGTVSGTYSNKGGAAVDFQMDSAGNITVNGKAAYLEGTGANAVLTTNKVAATAQAKVEDLFFAASASTVAGQATIDLGGKSYTSGGTTTGAVTFKDTASRSQVLDAIAAQSAQYDSTTVQVGTGVSKANILIDNFAGRITGGTANDDLFIDAKGDLTDVESFKTRYQVDQTTGKVSVIAGGKITGGARNGEETVAADQVGQEAYVDAKGNLTLEKSSAGTKTTDPLKTLDAAFTKLDKLTGELGAVQNRLESTIANLNNVVNNLSSARSRIQDADYATEVSNMSKAQILQQAGTSVLAQANQVPQTVLSLLR